MIRVAERMITACAPTIAASSSSGVRSSADLDLVAGRPEAVEATVGDLFGDEDASHAAMLTGERRPRQRP